VVLLKLPPPPGGGGGPLADRNLDPLVRLETVVNQLGRAAKEFDDACQKLDQLEANANPAGKNGRVERARYEAREAFSRWDALSDQADDLAKAIRRAQPLDSAYEKMYRAGLAELTEQFDGGPHYVLLCERVASLHARLRQIESGALDVPSIDHARMNQQLLSFINQLQKYTEAMKSEQISAEAQGVAEKILMIVEKNLATSYPELWRGVMREVRQALESAA
jgi:hypothetical protein